MICKIVDVVKDANNSLCIIMQKYNQSLEKIVEEYPKQLLPENYITRIFTMICMPLYYIHKNHIVHRDLKPQNILQKYIGDKEVFLITDFGTSKNTLSKQNKNTVNTLKTLPFASCEQL